MAFRKKSIKIDIVGQSWKITFHSPTRYLNYVAKDSKAVLDYDQRTLDVDLGYLTEELLRHELTHAYAKERSLVETQYTLDQYEEFFCEIFGKHGPQIVKQADSIARQGRKISWKRTKKSR